MGNETIYRDKNGEIIQDDSRLIDDENFIWEIKEQDGSYKIVCEDLLAEESIYPRAKYCTII